MDELFSVPCKPWSSGPAFGTVGPTDSYAHIPFFGKWVLSFLMVAGRLEIYTVLILLTSAFWQR